MKRQHEGSFLRCPACRTGHILTGLFFLVWIGVLIWVAVS